VNIQPYLFFDGRCEEALDYYQSVLGAEIEMIMRFRESPEPLPPGAMPPGAEDKVMHASFRVGKTEILASDGRCAGEPAFQGFSLAISARSQEEARRIFAALGDGGAVQMPLDRTFFAAAFGVVADRFGVSWMVMSGP
jgi:PhnB protein